MCQDENETKNKSFLDSGYYTTLKSWLVRHRFFERLFESDSVRKCLDLAFFTVNTFEVEKLINDHTWEASCPLRDVLVGPFCDCDLKTSLAN